jgi:hypothetical protein
MDNNNTLGYLALGAAAVYFFMPQQNETENMFLVPGVGNVPESELPALGYVKYNGQWFSRADIMAAAQANGVTTTSNIDVNTQVGFDIFMTLLNAGLGIATTVITNTAQRKADLIEQIETKYTLVVSTSYDPTFPFTNAQLKALTVAKLEKVLSGDFSITGVSEDYNLFYQTRCRDGKYSSSDGKGACSYHQGIRGHWTKNL